MADYYPLIARAIAGLDPSAPGESRRALYERARAALIAQLRSVQPPLSESEITRERLSLEEAVRKVESEAAQRARDASRSGDAPKNTLRSMRARPPRLLRSNRSPGPRARLRCAAHLLGVPSRRIVTWRTRCRSASSEGFHDRNRAKCNPLLPAWLSVAFSQHPFSPETYPVSEVRN